MRSSTGKISSLESHLSELLRNVESTDQLQDQDQVGSYDFLLVICRYVAVNGGTTWTEWISLYCITYRYSLPVNAQKWLYWFNNAGSCVAIRLTLINALSVMALNTAETGWLAANAPQLLVMLITHSQDRCHKSSHGHWLPPPICYVQSDFQP